MEDKWKSIREQSNAFRVQPSAQAWNRVRHKLDENKPGVVRMNARLWAAAASLVGLAAVAALLLLNNNFRSQANELALHKPGQLEILNSADTDAVARMAVDYTRFLQQHHPEMMDQWHELKVQGQSF